MSVKITATVFYRNGLGQFTQAPDGFIGRRVARAGKVVEDRAKQNVDRYGRVDTGRMRDTITVEKVEATSRGLNVEVVAPQPYARFQHWGTRWITAAPFLTDALKSLKVSDFR